jgi:hypothetical protein
MTASRDDIARPKLRHRDVIIARERAHAAFDQLHLQGWKTKDEAYAWLAGTMSLPSSEAHIGRMSIEQCAQVYDLATARLRSLSDNARGQAKAITKRIAKLERLHEQAQGALRTQDHGACYNALRAIVEQLGAALNRVRA